MQNCFIHTSDGSGIFPILPNFLKNPINFFKKLLRLPKSASVNVCDENSKLYGCCPDYFIFSKKKSIESEEMKNNPIVITNQLDFKLGNGRYVCYIVRSRHFICPLGFLLNTFPDESVSYEIKHSSQIGRNNDELQRKSKEN